MKCNDKNAQAIIAACAGEIGLKGEEPEKMYICLDCNKLFDSPKRYVETHGLDTPPYETWTGCPSCGGSYVSATECDECGDYVYCNICRNWNKVLLRKLLRITRCRRSCTLTGKGLDMDTDDVPLKFVAAALFIYK